MSNLPSNILSILLGECVGTFILLTIILIIISPQNTKPYGIYGIAIPIGIALIFSIYLFGNLTGGHFNPIVSLILYLKDPDTFGLIMLLCYVIVQIIGGALALQLSKVKGFYNLIFQN